MSLATGFNLFGHMSLKQYDFIVPLGMSAQDADEAVFYRFKDGAGQLDTFSKDDLNTLMNEEGTQVVFPAQLSDGALSDTAKALSEEAMGHYMRFLDLDEGQTLWPVSDPENLSAGDLGAMERCLRGLNDMVYEAGDREGYDQIADTLNRIELFYVIRDHAEDVRVKTSETNKLDPATKAHVLESMVDSDSDTASLEADLVKP